MAASPRRKVTVEETGEGPYVEMVTIGHHVLRADEGEALGGGDAGPSPYEYVMAALGACTAMTLRLSAARHHWPLEKTSVVVKHSKTVSSDGKTFVDKFERMIHLQGELSDAQRAHLLEVADECPISQTLQRSSLVVSTLAEASLGT